LMTVSGVFSIGIAVALVVFAVRYRRRSEDEVPAAIHGSLALELVWSVIPLGLTMIMFFWGAHVFFTISRAPANAEEVLVVGKQWMWKFQHGDGRREINELHVPLGKPIRLTMSSEDVIHSLYVPAFRVKQDVLPGRYSTIWFEATRPGRYHLFCAEYCGTEHSRMIGSVVVLDPSQYEEWLAGVPPARSPAAAGEALYTELGCQTCHKPDGTGLGPALAGLVGRAVELQDGGSLTADEGYVRESILTPQSKLVKGFLPVMPTFQGRVTEEQMMQLIAYIKSLG
ncbi:MAG: cytochrome c oxidase subunit II, partial [Candidatus Binatia bacterium]